MSLPMSDEMRRRWKQWKLTVDEDGEAVPALKGNDGEAYTTLSQFEPNAEVYVTRGLMRNHFFPHPHYELTPSKRRQGTSRWRGDWDEKYTWYGQPGEESKYHTNPDGSRAYGGLQADNLVGPIQLPYIKQVSLDTSLEQNGIATATVTIRNAEWQELTDPFTAMIHHMVIEGFFSPFYSGEQLGDTELDVFRNTGVSADAFNGAGNPNPIYNDDGKMISGLLLPNRKIEIYQGYGDQLQRTFVGLIGDVTISTKRREISLACANYGRVGTEVNFTTNVMPPKSYPVAFADAQYWKGPAANVEAVLKNQTLKQWTIDKGGTPQAILVDDITDIVGHLCGWMGFQSFHGPLAGRIGGIGTSPDAPAEHNAVFDATTGAFDKGNYLVDGINRIKELLGWEFYITPDFDPDKPLADRFTDPTVYDEEYSRYTIGVPHFEPSNIWQLNAGGVGSEVEQFVDDEILMSGELVYSNDSIRKRMYVTNSGVTDHKGNAKTIGFSAPWELERGISKDIYYDVRQSMGNINLTQLETAFFILMTMMKTVMNFCKASFDVPGYPGAKLNDQCHVLETTSGTWRRFYISGFRSEMTLGPGARYVTTLQTVNIDNIYINRLRDRIISQGGFGADMGFNGTTRETSKPAA